MRGPKPTKIELSDNERRQLEQIGNQNATLQPVALRAQIVLAAASGMNNCQIAHQLQVSLDMVRRWRKRWYMLRLISGKNVSITDRLNDAPRSGKLRHITAAPMRHLSARVPGEPLANVTQPTTQDSGYEIIGEEQLLEREVAV
jgi:hypothetical protein